MNIDWSAIGSWIAGIGIAATSAWGLIQKFKKDKAETRADIAESDAGRTVADAQQTVYRLLTERLSKIEGEMTVIRSELASERTHNRKLEVHIWKLENLMRKAGIEPPVFDTVVS